LSGAPAITARGLGKRYPRDRSSFAVFRRAMTGKVDQKGFWALRDVSFTVRHGEALGVVGRNGSGKSTLLQLICGTLQPTVGELAVTGRVAAMLELGAGFNPDFTGRENVFLTAAVYGLANRQIRARLPAIEAFADIGGYFDRPVAEYSSGMYARLAFAVCAHVDADILVVDEILGVGDAAFQHKCHRFMQAFRQKGTLVFVSHDAGAVLASCEQAIWLDAGQLQAHGAAEDVLARYLEAQTASEYDLPETPGADLPAATGATTGPVADARLGERSLIRVSAFNPDCASHGFGGARIVDCYFTGDDGRRRELIRGGETVTLTIRARVLRELVSPIFGYILRDAAGQNLFGDNTFLTYRRRPPTIAAGTTLEARLQFRMPYLGRGDFTLAPSLIAGTQHDHIPVNWLEDALVLTVDGAAIRHGKIGAAMRELRATCTPIAPTSGQAVSPVGGEGSDGDFVVMAGSVRAAGE
jgi:lipopolysaccharide transport system ATP-binding protein